MFANQTARIEDPAAPWGFTLAILVAAQRRLRRRHVLARHRVRAWTVTNPLSDSDLASWGAATPR